MIGPRTGQEEDVVTRSLTNEVITKALMSTGVERKGKGRRETRHGGELHNLLTPTKAPW